MTTPSPTTAVSIVSRLLSNTSSPSIVRSLVSPTATYVSLTHSNPLLKKILPYAGTHDAAGPDAVIDTFAYVAKIWGNEEFGVDAIFASPRPAAGTAAGGTDGGGKGGEGGAPATTSVGTGTSTGGDALVDVAVFGTFTYRSKTLGKACRSPYSVWCKVDEGKGQVVYMQFMEDTLGTTETFKVDGGGGGGKVGGYGTYKVDPDTGEEVEV